MILKNEYKVKLESNYGMGSSREYKYSNMQQAITRYNNLVSKLKNNNNYKNCVLKLIHNDKMIDFSKYELKGEQYG